MRSIATLQRHDADPESHLLQACFSWGHRLRDTFLPRVLGAPLLRTRQMPPKKQKNAYVTGKAKAKANANPATGKTRQLKVSPSEADANKAIKARFPKWNRYETHKKLIQGKTLFDRVRASFAAKRRGQPTDEAQGKNFYNLLENMYRADDHPLSRLPQGPSTDKVWRVFRYYIVYLV